jgi:hypothetical protein
MIPDPVVSGMKLDERGTSIHPAFQLSTLELFKKFIDQAVQQQTVREGRVRSSIIALDFLGPKKL